MTKAHKKLLKPWWKTEMLKYKQIQNIKYYNSYVNNTNITLNNDTIIFKE